jgi:hypothetical protein
MCEPHQRPGAVRLEFDCDDRFGPVRCSRHPCQFDTSIPISLRARPAAPPSHVQRPDEAVGDDRSGPIIGSVTILLPLQTARARGKRMRGSATDRQSQERATHRSCLQVRCTSRAHALRRRGICVSTDRRRVVVIPGGVALESSCVRARGLAAFLEAASAGGVADLAGLLAEDHAQRRCRRFTGARSVAAQGSRRSYFCRTAGSNRLIDFPIPLPCLYPSWTACRKWIPPYTRERPFSSAASSKLS